MRISTAPKGLIPVEVAVLIGVAFAILLLASIAVPCFSCIQIRAKQTRALNNAKTIGLCCKQFAIDHNGRYPNFTVIDGTLSKTQISDDSNTAFNQLFPDYLTTIEPFYQPESAWTPVQLNDPSPATMAKHASLPAGANEWAYVVGLSDTSDSTFPLIANGFADLKRHAYSTTKSARGGVWKGQEAIVVFCDDSAKVMRCDPSTHTVPGSPSGADLFDTSGQPHWLNSKGPDGQHVLNPW